VSDVLTVSNAALRFQPPVAAGTQPRPARGSDAPTRLWVVGEGGALESIEVRAGISDGTTTAVETDDPRLQDGLQVVSGTNQAAGTTAAVNPFQQTSGGGRPGGF
jgi:hypothetical protein